MDDTDAPEGGRVEDSGPGVIVAVVAAALITVIVLVVEMPFDRDHHLSPTRAAMPMHRALDPEARGWMLQMHERMGFQGGGLRWMPHRGGLRWMPHARARGPRNGMMR